MREQFELLSNKQIDRLSQASAQQHLREACNEVRWLRHCIEVAHRNAKEGPPLERELTRIPLSEGKVS